MSGPRARRWAAKHPPTSGGRGQSIPRNPLHGRARPVVILRHRRKPGSRRTSCARAGLESAAPEARRMHEPRGNLRLRTNTQSLQFRCHKRRHPLQAVARNSAMDEIVEIVHATLPQLGSVQLQNLDRFPTRRRIRFGEVRRGNDFPRDEKNPKRIRTKRKRIQNGLVPFGRIGPLRSKPEIRPLVGLFGALRFRNEMVDFRDTGRFASNRKTVVCANVAVCGNHVGKRPSPKRLPLVSRRIGAGVKKRRSGTAHGFIETRRLLSGFDGYHRLLHRNALRLRQGAEPIRLGVERGQFFTKFPVHRPNAVRRRVR